MLFTAFLTFSEGFFSASFIFFLRRFLKFYLRFLFFCLVLNFFFADFITGMAAILACYTVKNNTYAKGFFKKRS